MGQQGSRSTMEARVLFQRAGAVDVFQKTDPCSTPAPVVRIQKKVSSHGGCVHSSTRTPDRSPSHCRSHNRSDAGGLVYVMDNPTGGVWVKPGEKWSRSWWRHVFFYLWNFMKQPLSGCKMCPEASPEKLLWLPVQRCTSLVHPPCRSAGGVQVHPDSPGWADHCNLLIVST